MTYILDASTLFCLISVLPFSSTYPFPFILSFVTFTRTGKGKQLEEKQHSKYYKVVDCKCVAWSQCCSSVLIFVLHRSAKETKEEYK